MTWPIIVFRDSDITWTELNGNVLGNGCAEISQHLKHFVTAIHCVHFLFNDCFSRQVENKQE